MEYKVPNRQEIKAPISKGGERNIIANPKHCKFEKIIKK